MIPDSKHQISSNGRYGVMVLQGRVATWKFRAEKDRLTPFAFPVVPDVNTIAAISDPTPQRALVSSSMQVQCKVLDGRLPNTIWVILTCIPNAGILLVNTQRSRSRGRQKVTRTTCPRW